MDTLRAQKRLQQMKTELEQRLRKLESDLKSGRSRDWEEQAQERENDDVLDALAAEAKLELDRIHGALHKIEDGSYGKCSKCGNSIEEKRLEAIVDAESCLECAQRLA